MPGKAMVAPDKNDLVVWLDSLGLGMHAEVFAKNDVTLDLVRTLSDADLRELGLSMGHRRILMGAANRRASKPVPRKADQGERRA